MPKTVHVAAAGVAFAGCAVWILGDWSQGVHRQAVDDILFIVLTVPAVVFSALAARSSEGRLRVAWWAMTIGLAGWGVGEVIWAYYELRLGESPFPTVADAAYLVFPIGACVALLLFPAGQSGQFRARILLDGLIVAGALFMVFWLTVLKEVYEAGTTHQVGFVISLAYPVSDLVVLTVAAVALVRASADERLSLTLLTVGLACMALSDSAFAYLAARGQYASGNAIDLGWVAGLLLITVAAAAGREAAQAHRKNLELPGWASVWLPYAPLLAAALVAAAQPVPALQSAVIETVAILLVIAVLLRQFLAVSENRQLVATVADQALRDPLTGLANRVLFSDRLSHAMQMRQRDGLSVGVMALDLNDFKLVNDTLGHPAGDELLSRAAERILGCVRAGDTVARVGGDEFAVLVEGRVDQSHRIAQRVMGAFDPPFVIEGHELLIKPSIGLAVADADEPELSADDLLRRADQAMYSAKRSRLGGVHTYHAEMRAADAAAGGPFGRSAQPSPGHGVAMVRLLGELRQAIDQFQLILVYQPKFDLRTSRVVGVEALLRWPHPERGLLGPEEFLPLVRRHGLMGSITDLVVTLALDDALGWHRAGFDVPLAVNLFAPSMADLNLPARIEQALSARGLSPAALTVEITEDLFLDNLDVTKTVLTELRDGGVRIAIDDFGSGYSALSYLRDLPIDEVKLDRAFIAPIRVDRRAAAVVRAVIDLAHVLGLTTVAEGVEDAETVERLREYRCDVVQGYHYGAPLAAEDVPAMLERSGFGADEPVEHSRSG